MTQALTPVQHARRLRAGWRIVHEDGNISDLADHEGVSKAAIHHWLVRHQLQDLHDALRGGRNKGTMPRDKAWRRVEMLAECIETGTQFRTVAIAEGVSEAAICAWKKKNWLLIEEALYERRAA